MDGSMPFKPKEEPLNEENVLWKTDIDCLEFMAWISWRGLQVVLSPGIYDFPVKVPYGPHDEED